MYDGDGAVISMAQNLQENGEKDETLYKGTVIEYQKELEQVHLLMSSGELTNISLDAIYECRIRTMQGESVCTGFIRERYANHAGMILILQVTNGFYEINVK